jgi:regulator of sirC expression with transglutaminase-like and TPR domain
MNSGNQQLDDQWEREKAARAKRTEEILKQHVCQERAKGDRLSSEKLAEVKAKKDKDREELMKQNAEWQKRKIMRN